MSQPITVLLSDAAYQAFQRRAQAVGKSPAECAAVMLVHQFHLDHPPEDAACQSARDRFERHFGEVGSEPVS